MKTLIGDIEAMQLREVPQGDPTAALNGNRKFHIVNLIVCRHVRLGDAFAVDNQFDKSRSALRKGGGFIAPPRRRAGPLPTGRRDRTLPGPIPGPTRGRP